jgi:2',3'-cyclic-nucleotide 2'-phosphodiesterase (5'-nucleotidase family)
VGEPVLKFLHTNDFHGQLSSSKAATLFGIREEHDLWLDSGDAIKAGNLGIPFWQEEVWARFAEGGLTAMVPGNRESHVWRAGVKQKFAGSQTPILCANWKKRDGSLVWPESLVVESRGYRIGLFGVMVAMVTPRMKTQAASAYLWDQPIDAAREVAARLKGEVDVLAALTHIGIQQDRRLAQACPEIDLIFGGHSHTVLSEPEVVNGVVIVQGGSHARFCTSMEWCPSAGVVSHRLVKLG